MDSDIIHSLIITREVLILTLLILLPCGDVSQSRDDVRMAIIYLESECIKLYIHSDLEISLGPREFPRPWPLGVRKYL